MSEHTRRVHELFYWIEIGLAPLLLWLLYRLCRWAWSRGWLGDEWPDPQSDALGLLEPDVPPADESADA